MKKLSILLRVFAAIILLQTLYFKFSGHPESVKIFTQLELEPYGRIFIGFLELITGILLLIPSSAFVGAFLGIGLMAGAIFSHLTVLGIVYDNDGGLLFILAVIVMIFCSIILFIHKEQAFTFYSNFFKKYDKK
jgi:putative oxidoreductase